MENTEKDVIAWHRETFPNATIQAIVLKLIEEMEEFDNEMFPNNKKVNPYTTSAIEEFADVCIVFMSGLDRLGKRSLSSYIKEKLKVNKNRVWGDQTKNGDRPRVK